jgi:hypothetical protein
MRRKPVELLTAKMTANLEYNCNRNRTAMESAILRSDSDGRRCTSPTLSARSSKPWGVGQGVGPRPRCHMAVYDDQQIYFEGLIGFIRDVEDSIV